MKTEWFRNAESEEEAEKIKSSVRSSSNTLERLSEICSQKIKELDSVSIDDYDTPSWASKQAHINGLKEAYRKIIDLCNIKQETFDQNV